MRKISTISLETVKAALRRGKGGAVRNEGGWCVFADASGKRFYVVDETDQRPVPFQRVSTLRASYVNAVGASPWSSQRE